MKSNHQKPIEKPVGLKAVCAYIEDVCSRARFYQYPGAKPPCLMIALDAGEGRTTFLEYLADCYKQSGIYHFKESLDEFLELDFDGTLENLEDNFRHVRNATDYSNAYTGIIGMHISPLSRHLHEKQMKLFISGIKAWAETANLVFFTSICPERNEKILMQKISGVVKKIKQFDYQPYTNDELRTLLRKKLTLDYGIQIKNQDLLRFENSAMQLIQHADIKTVKEITLLAESMALSADYKGIPRLRLTEEEMETVAEQLITDKGGKL